MSSRDSVPNAGSTWGAASLVGCALVILVALIRPPTVLFVADLFCALIAIAGGALMIRQGQRQDTTRAKLFCTLMGIGVVASCFSLLVRAVGVRDVEHPSPLLTLPSLVCLVSITGAMLAWRRPTRRAVALREGLEVLLVASCYTVAGWRTVVMDVTPFELQVVRMAELGVSSVMLGIAVTISIKHNYRGLTISAVSALAIAVTSLATTGGGLVVQVAGALLSVAIWPWLMWGLLKTSPRPPWVGEGNRAITEPRSVVMISSVTVGCGAIIVHSFTDADIRPTFVLVMVILAALWLREVLRAAESKGLLTRLSSQALQDPLTGLANRRAFDAEMTRRQSLEGTPLALLTVDLDRFKDVNEMFGHPLGDACLKAVGRELERLASHYGAGAFRIGGDEFALLIDSDENRALELARRVDGAVRLALRGMDSLSRWPVGASVGVRALTGDDECHEIKKRVAGESALALRAAKATGKPVVLFDDAMAERERRRRDVERRLRVVLTGEDPSSMVRVRYQPVVDSRAGRVSGVEALARWDDAELGTVSPDEFIAVAEESGLIHALGASLLEQAVRGAKAARLAENGVSLAVNVSPLQLRVPGFADTVCDVLERVGVPSSAIVLEATESVLLAPGDPAVRTLDALSAAGMRVALDDFGTGFSSLDYLTRLPVRVLKMDSSMTRRLDEPRVWAIAATVVDLARRLDLEVVMEGVEHEQDLARADQLGVRLIQGWYYSAALDVAALAQVITLPMTTAAASGRDLRESPAKVIRIP